MTRGRPTKSERGKSRGQNEHALPSPLTPAARTRVLTVQDTEPESDSPCGYGYIKLNGVYRQINAYSWQEGAPGFSVTNSS